MELPKIQQCDQIDIIIPTMKSAADLAAMVKEIKATAGLPVRVIVTGQQASASVNRNYGLDQSTTDPLIMVDDDAQDFPDCWAKRLVEAMTTRPNCVMISALLVDKHGRQGVQMGWGNSPQREGVGISSERKLATACVAMRKTALRFEETLRGSGWEDNDMAFQLCAAFPDAEFCMACDVPVYHRNEMKSQSGANWKWNKRVIQNKWGHL